MANRNLGEVGAPLPISSAPKPGPTGHAPEQAIDPNQFNSMSAPIPVFRGDAGMHSPDLGYGEDDQVDVRLPFSGRIV